MALVEYSDDDESDSTAGCAAKLSISGPDKATGAPLAGVKRKRAEGEPAVGTWPTIVYLPIDSTASIISAGAQYARVVDGLYKVETRPLGAEDASFGLHVSVSRNLELRMPEIEPFVKRIQDACAGIGPFTMSLEGCQLFTNDDGSKTFLGLLLGIGQRDVVALIRRIDSVLRELGKQPYYDPPDPHVSTGFFTTAAPVEPSSGVKPGPQPIQSTPPASLPPLPTSFSAADLTPGESIPDINVDVSCVMVKVGIRTYQIELHK